MVVTAFKPSNEVLTFKPNFLPLHPTLANFTSALNAPNFLDDLRNSLIITGVVGGRRRSSSGSSARSRWPGSSSPAARPRSCRLSVQMVPVSR